MTTSAILWLLPRQALALLAAASLTCAAGARGAEPGRGAADAPPSQGDDREGRNGAKAVGDKLIGREVLSANGETVGEVVDVAFSRRHGEQAARISLIGFLGSGEREISLPVSRLSLTPDGEIQTTLSSEQLEAVPEVAEEFGQEDEGR